MCFESKLVTEMFGMVTLKEDLVVFSLFRHLSSMYLYFRYLSFFLLHQAKPNCLTIILVFSPISLFFSHTLPKTMTDFHFTLLALCQSFPTLSLVDVCSPVGIFWNGWRAELEALRRGNQMQSRPPPTTSRLCPQAKSLWLALRTIPRP